MTPARDRGVRRAIVIVPLVFVAAIAGCGPLHVRSLRWALSGFDFGRMLARGAGARRQRDPLDGLKQAVDRALRNPSEPDRSWLREDHHRHTRPSIETVASLEALDAVVDVPADFFYRRNPDGELPTLRVDGVEFTDGTVWIDPDRRPAP